MNYSVSPSMTSPAHLHKISNGKFLDDILLGVACFFVVYIHDNINFCVNVIVLRILARVLLECELSSSWVI